LLHIGYRNSDQLFITIKLLTNKLGLTSRKTILSIEKLEESA